MKNRRLLQSLSFIDDKYVKEAEPKMAKSTSTNPLIAVACLALVAILGLYLFIPLKPNTVDLSVYADSEYSPLIAAIDNYVYKPKQYKNNFKRLTSLLGNFNFGLGMSKGDAAPPEYEGSTSNVGNSYVETTDNQVNGVIEADLLKRTETHAFRLNGGNLKVYSIAKEQSTQVATAKIPKFSDEYTSNSETEMYLSMDGSTLTVISKYYDKDYASKVGITRVDVSDPNAPTVKNQVSVDGEYNSSRMVDGRLILISEFHLNQKQIDYAKPETFVPTVTEGDVTKCIEFSNIIYPEKLNNLRYSVVALIDESTLDVLDANALLCYNSSVYVSNDNVYVTRGYSFAGSFDGSEYQHYSHNLTDVTVLCYSNDTLENKGTLTAEGNVKDQYSMDEYEGHFRLVTSTFDRSYVDKDDYREQISEILGSKSRSATLTVFELESMTKVVEIKDFAPEGEEAMSVRFDGDRAYVCTAEVITMSDPVYFFDLSDYSNVTYTDTGVIAGFSTSLIQLGDGYLLGIGVDGKNNVKIEVYEERDGQVISTDSYVIFGEYSTEYKSYFIDREKNLFGIPVLVYENSSGYYSPRTAYLLFCFNGNELVLLEDVEMYNGRSVDIGSVRAFIADNYLYITDDFGIKAVNTVPSDTE